MEMAASMEDKYRQILYEKEQLLQMRTLLEQQLDEASDATSTSQDRISALEVRSESMASCALSSSRIQPPLRTPALPRIPTLSHAHAYT